MSIILLPIILILFFAVFLVMSIVDTVDVVSQGGIIQYDETTFQDYTQSAYYSNFTDVKTQEDGILVVVLAYEDYQEVAYIAWPGDNIKNNINNAFSTGSYFGSYFDSTVNRDNYKYSISKDLSKIIDYMSDRVVSYGNGSSFIVDHDMTNAPKSAAINKSKLVDLNEETISVSLERFTEATGIPIILLVDDAEAVFGKTIPSGNIVVLVFASIAIIACVVFIIVKLRQRRKLKADFDKDQPVGDKYGGGVDEDMF